MSFINFASNLFQHVFECAKSVVMDARVDPIVSTLFLSIIIGYTAYEYQSTRMLCPLKACKNPTFLTDIVRKKLG